MPELPEVETTRRGIEPHLLNRTVTGMCIRQRQLRWPVSRALPTVIERQPVTGVSRRGKYLLIGFPPGVVLIHLGMSGSLRLVPADSPPGKHDHLDMRLDSGRALRLTDPRRFGAVLWTAKPVLTHKLLKNLGVEPLSDEFSGDYLFRCSRKRKQAVKTLIMDSQRVVGVGNIYANEALFLAGIRPRRQAARLTQVECERLVDAIKQVLRKAIRAGGTTLRDFTGGDGKPGYFRQKLSVYGRGGEDCHQCGSELKSIRQGQRATVYCPRCQQ